MRKHIELFAGCGGMAVGMEAAGFSLLFANEVSPMACNTFAYNLLGTDITQPNEKVRWIHSRFDRMDYDKRLRENLLSHKEDENCEPNFRKDLSDLNGGLLVGDIRHLKNKLIENNIQDPYKGNLDLISGGPPCQSFSLAGKRELNNYKNILPLDFAEVCEILNPKVVLLENVKGILSAFKDGENKYYAWFEVAKAFGLKGFVPICMLLNSKVFGVAQNRPRYVMIALRKDIFLSLKEKFPSHSVLQKSSSFIQKIDENFEKLCLEDLDYYDIEKDLNLFDGNVLPRPITFEKAKWVSAKDAIDDLIIKGSNKESIYVNQLKKQFKNKFKVNKELYNHDLRIHSNETKSRFLFYQLLNYGVDFKERFILNKKNYFPISEKEIKSLYDLLESSLNDFNSLFDSFAKFKKFIREVNLTKKHSQRALIETQPSPAQLTIPDDICHYSPFENRVLTVREMARIQSFPDWFVFKSKITTGGKNRSYEVPQYTQVGNAVPPLLAYNLGKHINSLLDKIENNEL